MHAVLKNSNLSRWAFRGACFVVIVAMLRGSYPELYVLQTLRTDADFWGYFTASTLLRTNHPMSVYEEATRNVDPIEERAMPDSEFARTARTFGVSDVGLYDYPPTLADLLLPLTYVPPPAALIVWEVLNLVATLAGALILIGILDVRGAAPRFLTAVLVLLFRPTLDSLCWGQVAGLLFLVLIAGLALYMRGRHGAASLLFALGVAIKLTPLVLFIPLIARKDWRTVWLFAGWCAAIFAALVAVNGWPMIDLYFVHELPRMATKFLNNDNRTLSSLLQILLGRTTTGARWLGRLASAAVVLFAGWLCLRDRRHELLDSAGLETLAIFLLFSCCLAPLAWLNAYEVAIPALAAVAKRVVERKAHILELVTFVGFMLAASTEKYRWLGMTMPFFAVILGLLRLRALRVESPPNPDPAV